MVEADAILPIESDRLILVPVDEQQAMDILRNEMPATLSFSAGYPAQFSIEVMDLLVGERKNDATGFRPFFIKRKVDGRIIGDMGWSFPKSPDTAEVGYGIVEPMWNQGYATEALGALIARLFTLPDVKIVKAETLKDLVASRRVMEKVGMVVTGNRTEEDDGQPLEIVQYEIAKPSSPA